MLDQLRQIAIFAKTVDHGSFRAAARSLRLSPSVLSHHVTQLEQTTGTALIYRSTRKLSLTPDGERLLAAARIMLDAAETGLAEVSSHKQQPSGLLRVTMPAVLARSKIGDRIAAFAIDFPNIRLSIDFSDVRRELIGDGFDIAIRMGWLEDSSFKARKLFDVQRYLVAAPDYLNTLAKPTTPKDLTDWEWLELTPVWRKKREFQNGSKRMEIAIPESRISVNDAQVLYRLTCLGAGLAILPDFLIEADVSTEVLQIVLPKWALPSAGVHAVWPSNAPRDGLVKHFVNFLTVET